MSNKNKNNNFVSLTRTTRLANARSRGQKVQNCSNVNQNKFAGLVGLMTEKDEKRKAEKEEKMQKETVPNAMCNLEKILSKNGGKYFVGNCVSTFKYFLKLS